MPESLKEWKVAITSVGQGYEFTEGCHDYKTGTRTTYCYDLRSLEWDSKTTLVLSNPRELDRVPKTK